MTQQQVIDRIRTWIIQNGQNEITANVLRPILEDILNQPNTLIGDLTTLTTTDQTNLVNAINELNQKWTQSNFEIHTGSTNPNTTPPAEYGIGDFYIHDNNGIQAFYQFNGDSWIKITNKDNSKVTEIFFDVVPTAGATTTKDELVTHINTRGFEIEANEQVVLSAATTVNSGPVFASYFFKRNNLAGTWGDGTTNGPITEDDLILNILTNDVELLKARGVVIELGDIGTQNPWEYLNNNPEPSAGEWQLNDNEIYFFTYTQNSQSRTAMYQGPQPVSLGTTGNYIAVEADFGIISDVSSVTKQYVDDQDIAIRDAVLAELDYYILKTQKGQPLGVATLNADGTIPQEQLGKIAITEVITAAETSLANFAANFGAYEFQQGDVIVITDTNNRTSHYLYKGGPENDTNNYSQIEVSDITIDQVIGLQAALNAKADTAHEHAAGDVTSGVFAIARIPTGTSSTTVALGDHSHTFASITAKPTTLAGYGITNAYTKTEVDNLKDVKLLDTGATGAEGIVYIDATDSSLWVWNPALSGGAGDYERASADQYVLTAAKINTALGYTAANDADVDILTAAVNQLNTDVTNHETRIANLEQNAITTETDPTVPQHVKNITVTDIQNWNTDPTETDPTVPQHVKNITETDIQNWNNPPDPNLDNYVRVDAAQAFNQTQRTQGRANINAQKKTNLVITNSDVTPAEVIQFQDDTILVASGSPRTITLPETGIADGHQFMVKTIANTAAQFAPENANVTIEYNLVNAIGYMSARSEAWVIYHAGTWYVNGEVA